MRVLYFAPPYYSSDGGRTHARCFFAELARDPRVSHAVIFPPEPAPPPAGPARRAEGSTRPWGEDLRAWGKSAYRLLPSFLRDQADLRFPSPTTYAALSAALVRESIDTAVLRLGRRFRYVERLKRDHPQLRLCVEYNASPFDERLKGIAGERLWRHEEARQLSRAGCVSVVSDYLRRYLISIHPALEASVFVNPNGADPSVFKPPDPAVRERVRRRLGIPTGAFVVGYVGGMEEWRRLPEIVSWAAKARGAGLERLFLAVIGTGQDLQRVLAAIDDPGAGLAGRAYCSKSWVASAEVSELMTGFDAGLLSFQHPHCCQQKAFEYLLCGLPVVGPPGSFPDGLLSSQYGTFEFGHDAGSFAATLRSVQDGLDTCGAAALRGRERVASEFTWKANASRVLAALERLP